MKWMGQEISFILIPVAQKSKPMWMNEYMNRQQSSFFHSLPQLSHMNFGPFKQL